MLKKLVSVVLCVTLLTSIMTVIPVSANTEETQKATHTESTIESSYESKVEFVDESKDSSKEKDNTSNATESTEKITDSKEESQPPKSPKKSKSKLLLGSSYTVNGFSYDVNNKEATITGFSDRSITSISIPDKIGGYPVTSIGNYSFSGFTNLETIDIPNSVTVIGENAFNNTAWYNNQADGLVYAGSIAYKYKGTMPEDTIITLNDNTTSITSKAFYNCANLKKIVFNNSISNIGSYVFYGCTALSEVTLPESINSIGQYSFSNCSSLRNVTINSNIESIPSYLFNNCTALESISLPNSITSIGEYAFANDVSLSGVVLPQGITTINNYAFQNCTSITEITVPKTLTTGSTPFSGCENLTKITFESGIESVPSKIAQNCNGLTEITLPDSVTKIGEYAFYHCDSLESIDLPDSITEIGRCAFLGSSALATVKLPKNLNKLCYGSFENCSALKEITIPKTLTQTTVYSIYTDNIFQGCTSLKKIVFEEGMETIPQYIATNCENLEEVVIPDSVKSIEQYAFYNCKALESISLPNSITSIGEYAFANDVSLSGVVLPQGITTINNYAFQNCTSITEITVPKTLTTASTPFSGCENLTIITFESGIEAVPSKIAQNCNGLTEITLPDSVTKIGEYAFYHCDSLESIDLPDSITEIGRCAFLGSSALATVKLPKNLNKLCYGSFENCSALKEITIPKTLTQTTVYSIYTDNIFQGCTSLKKIVFEEGMETIPQYIATNCENLEEVVIPESVKSIEQYAFYNCKALESISLPDSITSIDSYAFSYCDSLKAIYLSEKTESVNDYAFYNCKNLIVYCAKYSKLAISFIDKNIEVVSHNDNRSLESVVLDDSKSYFEARNTSGTSFVCNYSIKSSSFSSAKNPYVKIKIPNGANISAQSLYVDNDLCTDYSDYTSYITIPVSKREGKITFNLTYSGECKLITYATLNYTLNGKNDYDIIDIINNDIPVIAVYSEAITSSEKVHITGMAPASSEVKVSVDGNYLKSINANKVGSFSTDIELPSLIDGKEYRIEVCAEHLGNTIKNETTVKYKENAPELLSFTMQYKGVTYDLMSGKNYSVSIVPNINNPFRFEVRYSNSEKIGLVKVSSIRNQVIKSVEAKWDDETKSFVFEGFFDNNNYSYIPGKITCSYTLKNNLEKIDEPIAQEDLPSWAKNAKVTEETNTENKYKADIELTGGQKFNYECELNVPLEVLEERYLTDYAPKSSMVNKKAKLLTAASGASSSVGEFFAKLLLKYGEKALTNAFVDCDKNGGLFAVLVDDRINSMVHVYWDPAKDVLNSTVVKYAGGELIDCFADLSYTDAVSTAGFVYGAGKTIVKLANQTIEVQDTKHKIINSNLSSSEKSRVSRELDTLQMGYTCVAGFKVLSSIAGVAATAALGPLGGLLVGLTSGLLSGWFTNILDSSLEEYQVLAASNMNFLVDPSGYVYEGVLSNRVINAKVTTYWIPYDEDDDKFWDSPNDSNAIIWDADEYSQVNPLYTDSNGDYAWDVPEGWWKVVAEKDGYETYTTEWLPVPPPQTDVNINLIKKAKPTVESVEVTDDGELKIVFDTYMNPSTVENIVLSDVNSENISYKLNYDTTETDINGTIYARTYVLKISDGKTINDIEKVTVPFTVVNYAGKTVDEYVKSMSEIIAPTEPETETTEATEATTETSEITTTVTEPVTENTIPSITQATEPVTEKTEPTTVATEPTTEKTEPTNSATNPTVIVTEPTTEKNEPTELESVPATSESQTVTTEATEPVVTISYFFLPDVENENKNYNYKLLVQDNKGAITIYDFAATDLMIDGVKVYSAAVPADIVPIMLYYQVYNGETWLEQIAKNGDEVKEVIGNIVKNDGSIVGKEKPTESLSTEPTETQTEKPTEPVVTQPATETSTQAATEAPKTTSKKPNPIKVSVKKKTVKLKKLKKKAQTVKAITVKNAKGKVTYKLVAKGISKRIRKLVKISSKGVITIKRWKKAKKGNYKIKVSITAAGNKNYLSETIKKTVKIKIK